MPPKPPPPAKIVNPGEEQVFFALLRNALEEALRSERVVHPQTPGPKGLRVGGSPAAERLWRLIEQLREGIGEPAIRSETRGGAPPYGFSDLGVEAQLEPGYGYRRRLHESTTPAPPGEGPFLDEQGNPYYPGGGPRPGTQLYEDLSRRGPAEAWIKDPKSKQWRQLGPNEPLYPPGGRFPPFGGWDAPQLGGGETILSFSDYERARQGAYVDYINPLTGAITEIPLEDRWAQQMQEREGWTRGQVHPPQSGRGATNLAGQAAGGAGAGALLGGLTQLPQDEPEDLRQQRIIAQAMLAGEPVSPAAAMTPETGAGKVAQAQSTPQPGLVRAMLERGRGGLQQVAQGAKQIGKGLLPPSVSGGDPGDIVAGAGRGLLGAWEAVSGPIAEAAGRGSDALWRALQMPSQASQAPTGTPPRPAMPPLMGLPPPRTGAQGSPEERRQALRNVVEQLAYMGGPGAATRGARAFGQGLEGLAASGGPVSRIPHGKVTLDPRSAPGGQRVLEEGLRWLRQASPAAYRRVKYDPREITARYRPRIDPQFDPSGQAPTVTQLTAEGRYVPSEKLAEVYNAPSPLEMVRPHHPDEHAFSMAEELWHAAQDLAGTPYRVASQKALFSPEAGLGRRMLEAKGYDPSAHYFPWEFGALPVKGLSDVVAPPPAGRVTFEAGAQRAAPLLKRLESTLDYPQAPPMWRK